MRFTIVNDVRTVEKILANLRAAGARLLNADGSPVAFAPWGPPLGGWIAQTPIDLEAQREVVKGLREWGQIAFPACHFLAAAYYGHSQASWYDRRVWECVEAGLLDAVIPLAGPGGRVVLDFEPAGVPYPSTETETSGVNDLVRLVEAFEPLGHLDGAGITSILLPHVYSAPVIAARLHLPGSIVSDEDTYACSYRLKDGQPDGPGREVGFARLAGHLRAARAAGYRYWPGFEGSLLREQALVLRVLAADPRNALIHLDDRQDTFGLPDWGFAAGIVRLQTR